MHDELQRRRWRVKEWIADLSDELRVALERAIAARLPADFIEDASNALADLVLAHDVISAAARARRMLDAIDARLDGDRARKRELRRRTG